MYLKSIEVQGFKSFANKIVFRFHKGITGIVGPNGSGKSNVADAVRWVLGEQRVKQLRGGSMQDVIFAGTENRKALGYASVAITLDNSDHALPIDYNEVTVSRRLYRSGESEYLINGTACRLKDVNELFYDTGIGKEGYSIIGQGQIERILNGKPEERRELFDEAAGIVKYKRRKLEAQRKLESEHQNLIRVDDILSELSRQLGPLERQSEKAKIYLKCRDEMKAYDINIFLALMQDIKDELEKAQASFESASEELSDVKKEAEEIRRMYDSIQEESSAQEAEQNRLQEQLTAEKLREQQLEGEAALLREQIRTAQANEASFESRMSALESATDRKRSDAQKVLEGLEALREHLVTLEKEIEKKQEECAGIAEKIAESVKSSEQLQEQRISLLEQRSELQKDLERAETLLEQNRIRRSQLKAEILRLRSEESGQSGEIDRLQKSLDEATAKIDALLADSEEVEKELQKLQETLADDNQLMEQEMKEYHRDSSRLETLRNIAERYDGYGSSIRRVMENRKTQPGILGVVADLIRTKQEYETAIETALGGSIQNIVTEDENTARAMIEFLKREKAGRATFLPLTAIRGAQTLRNSDALSEPGVIGLASSLVTSDKKYEKLSVHLLGKTIVADTIGNAIALAKKYKYTLRIVTLEGELLNPGGAMTGGAFKNSSNLLGRRREIEELERIRSERGKKLDELRTKIDNARADRNRLRALAVEQSSRLQEQYLKQNTAKLRLKEMQERKGETREAYEKISEENRSITTQSVALEQSKMDAENLLRRSFDDEEEITEQLRKAAALTEEQRSAQQAASSKLEEIRLQLASETQKASFLQADLDRISGEISSMENEREEIIRIRETAGEDITSRTARIEEITSDAQQSRQTQEEITARLAELSVSREKIRKDQKTAFDRREELSEKNALLEKECFRLQNQIEKLEERREERISYMWEEYELTYSTALALKRDDLGSRSEWKKRMNALRSQIRELGNVNVNAIEEYKEVSERHTFLSGQHDDLIKAEKTLEKIIADLDEGMRVQFREQFERIRTEFNKVFQELFGGGKGTLELVEEEDILEAGVRIIAQPPGKKLQNMMQLSGGDKALTAIALLFAIQNLKPSPFCLLDEIEAALDENNVERYAQYLQKLTKYTQFIIITHRRGTMAAADRLYGITMQEKGVSALVSVNLIEEELDA